MGSSGPGHQSVGLAVDVELIDLLTFVTWLDKANDALKGGKPLPDAPPLRSVRVTHWVSAIRRLDTRHWETRAQYRAAEEMLRGQQTSLQVFTSNLYENLAVLYDRLGRGDKATRIRMRAAALYIS